ncbi:MAG: hypothetical protein ACR2HE_12425 [Casimicrobiaceae bacterium]
MLVPVELATVVDALTAIRIDLSSVLHAGDLPPKVVKRLETAIYSLDDTLATMTRQAREHVDVHDHESDKPGTGVGLEDFSPRGQEPGG